MKKSFARAAFSAILMGTTAAVAIVATAPAAYAADKAPQGPKVRKDLAAALQAATTAMQAKDFAAAKAQIAAVRAMTDLTEVEILYGDITEAQLTFMMNDHPATLVLYKRIVASPLFTQVESAEGQAGTLSNLAQLQLEAKDFPGTIQTGERLAASGQMSNAVASALATAYYFNKDYKKAVMLSQKAVDASIAANQKPPQGPLQILFNSYADQNDQANARKTLEITLTYYPSADSWAKLIDNSLDKGLSDMQILQIYRLRNLSGASGDATDYTIGSDVAMKNGYPGDARSMLQAASSRGVSGVGAKLAEAKTRAASDEKTVAASDAAAAKSQTALLDIIVAEQFYGYGRFGEAEAAAKRALSKSGGPKDKRDSEEAKMLVAMSQASAGKYADAVASFKTVAGDQHQHRIAELWIIYCQSKLKAAAPAN